MTSQPEFTVTYISSLLFSLGLRVLGQQFLHVVTSQTFASGVTALTSCLLVGTIRRLSPWNTESHCESRKEKKKKTRRSNKTSFDAESYTYLSVLNPECFHLFSDSLSYPSASWSCLISTEVIKKKVEENNEVVHESSET